jgi:acetate kinase
LRQKGHWSAEERVSLEGPKGRLEHVAILGPLRSHTQAEISRTDSFALGVDAPVRQSGDLSGAARIRLHGPAGTYDTNGLIVAARHIHMSSDDAQAWGLSDGDMVDVSLDGAARGLTFTHVLLRVSDKATTEMHIDTDEANAAGIRGAVEGEIMGDVQITQRHG